MRASVAFAFRGLSALLVTLTACGPKVDSPHAAGHGRPITLSHGKPLFVDVAHRAGLHFTPSNGAAGKFYPIEITPGGCAFLDYDGDGFQDIFLVQSGSSEPPQTVQNRPHCALYHNNGDGSFTDVTAGSGFDRDLGFLQGVAVGDYDNDGFPDIFLTGYGGNFLLHNKRGSGKFADVTHKMGLDNVKGYCTSAAFGDYDNDGRLDLYVCCYIHWQLSANIRCGGNLGADYCTPEVYDAESDHLYHNDGDHFTDVSDKAGIAAAKGRGLGVAFLDYDNDGRQDIFVANDLTPNLLWHNNGDGTFTDVAVEAGCAYDEGGNVLSGMGIGVADYDHSGRDSLFVANFASKPNSLYRNSGGRFQDESYASGLALPHQKYVAFGCGFLDYDADGWPDLFVTNGHVELHADRQMEGVTFKEPSQLFRNNGDGTFREITEPSQLGEIAIPVVGRGLAVGDYDNDGRLDVLVTSQNSPVQLFHNEVVNGNHWVSFLTVGTKSNREGRHARFELRSGGTRQTAIVRAGSSYLSASDPRVNFGLGKATSINRVEVRWPSGTKDVLTGVIPDACYVVTEGKGVTGKLPGGGASMKARMGS